jgi:16S rRNA (uracil1498-N3)-methyltransferase
LNDSAEFSNSPMSERFFVTPPIAGDSAVLTGDEARHLAAVMRLVVGAEVTVFDGSGAEFTARVIALRKHEVELSIVERRDISRELPLALALAVALPKGDRQKWLVEKATELGVTRLVPLKTERGVAQPVESALDRLRRGVIEASKQCGRNRLMEVGQPASAPDFFTATPTETIRLIADPSGQPLDSIPHSGVASLCAAIGPEGGFSAAELAAAHAAGWQAVSLGARILRIETAAIAMASWAALSRGT